ncbi:PaaI family thioesterase [Bradyrhizobium sp.]|uniref:PaaI family thioesterase n=1 Tax=Bradyrhizobium sp. TaxID=376 RepID=UPI002613ADA4|nr:PaaI family thioesterase [Bradyrhizobium sp.]
MLKTVLDDFPMPPSAKLLGWRLLDARPWDGWLKVGFDGRAEFCNPAGFIQGGILSAMLDDTMGPAAFVTSDGRFYTTTISLTVNFIAPARPGPLIAEAQVIQIGKSVAFMEGKLMADDGAVLATASTTARLVEAGRAIRSPMPEAQSAAWR